MITETKGYKTCDADGRNSVFHATLEEAQQHEIAKLIEVTKPKGDAEICAMEIMRHKSKILTILTGQRGKDKQPRKRKVTQEVQP